MEGLKDHSTSEIRDDNIFDSISEINVNNLSINYRKNTSFYSLNDEAITDTYKTRGSERKVDLDAVKMLPIYIDRVHQNIKILENLINKDRSEKNDKIIESSRENSKTKIKEIIKETQLPQNNSQKNFSNSKPAFQEFTVIEERDEDMFSRTSNKIEQNKKIFLSKPSISKKIIKSEIKTYNFLTKNSNFNTISTNSTKKSISNASSSTHNNTTIDVKKLKNSGENFKLKKKENTPQNTITSINTVTNNKTENKKVFKKAGHSLGNFLKPKDNKSIKTNNHITSTKKTSVLISSKTKPNTKSFTERNSTPNKKFLYAKSTPSLNLNKCCNCRCEKKDEYELKPTEVKSSVELFYMITDYMMNNGSCDMYLYSSLLKSLKIYFESEEDIAKTNYSENSSFIMNNSIEKKHSLLNKRREEKKNKKIIIIQRKWREYKISKLLKTNFSYINSNKSDIAKRCKNKIYSDLSNNEQFRKLIDLSGQLYEIWNKFSKSNLYENIKINLIHNDNYNNMSHFLSKIISADLLINYKQKRQEKLSLKEDKLDKLSIYKNFQTVNKPKSFHLHT